MLLDGLRSAIDDVLGLLQAEAGDLADNLDDLDLFLANGLEDNVKLSLGFGNSGRDSSSNSNRGSS